MSLSERLLKFFASLRLAVVIIVSLAVVAAVGTIVEARYNDSEMATKLVYQSPFMYAVLGVLIVQLIAVMIDRWPWRRQHTGFVLAHVGIITLLVGAWVTQRFGVDGSMAFEIGESRDLVQIRDRDILVFSSLGGGEMRNVYQGPADFIRTPPSVERPFTVNVGQDILRFLEFLPFAFRESDVLATHDAEDGPAARFQLENANVNLTQWLRLERGRDRAEMDLGPAKVVLTRGPVAPSGRNEIILTVGKGDGNLGLTIFGKDRALRRQGRIRQSETVDTGWMGLKLRLLRFLPHADEVVKYVRADYSTPMTTSAVRFELEGKSYWAGLNTPLKLFLADRAYIVVYGMRQARLGFPLHLSQFRMGKYQGTNRAATYESDVLVPGGRQVTISMNEPLKYGGYTFYQSSYEMNERGEPVVSVLSVNRDPGRWIKYLGSLLIVAGSIVLFWFKRMQFKAPKGRATG